MNNKGMGDFGGNGNRQTFNIKSNSGMGDMFSDFLKNAEREVNTFAQSLEEKTRETLQNNTSWLPPEMREQAEAAIKQAGGQMTLDLEKKLKAEAQRLLTQKAQAIASDPATQNNAITAGVNASAQQVSGFLISLKDSIMNGTVHKVHPIATGIAVGLPTLLFLKFMIGKKRTKVVYAKPESKAKKAKANPRKRRK